MNSYLSGLEGPKLVCNARVRLGSVVVRKLDLQSTGRGFDSRPPQRPWASRPLTCASVTEQYNLVPAKGR